MQLSRKMVPNTLIVLVFAIVTLLSCSSVSSINIIPRVTRTSDAIILDYSDDEAYGFPSEEIAAPGYPLPFFNSYQMMYQQSPNLYKEWSYFYRHSRPISSPVVPSSSRRLQEDNHLHVGTADQRQAATTTTTAATTTTTAATTTTTAATTTTTAATTTTTAATTTTRAPVAQCGKGAISTPTAGKRKRSLISEKLSGGSDAQKVWTFMVSLYDGTNFFCSGTLISSNTVLLAARCFEKMSQFQMSSVTVKVGGYKSDQSDTQMTRRIIKVVNHNQYNSATSANDIAIIIMDMPVVFSKSIGPVCLPPATTDPDAYAGQDAVILGWFKAAAIATAPAATDKLQQALVSISYNGDCKNDPTFGQYVTDSTTCIPSTSAFTCIADVGGPVLINSAPNVQGTTAVWTQIAINSYTKADSCKPGSTTGGLKTSVAAFVPWINTYMV